MTKDITEADRYLAEAAVMTEFSAELAALNRGEVRPRSVDMRAEAIRRGAVALRDVLAMDAQKKGVGNATS